MNLIMQDSCKLTMRFVAVGNNLQCFIATVKQSIAPVAVNLQTEEPSKAEEEINLIVSLLYKIFIHVAVLVAICHSVAVVPCWRESSWSWHCFVLLRVSESSPCGFFL